MSRPTDRLGDGDERAMIPAPGSPAKRKRSVPGEVTELVEATEQERNANHARSESRPALGDVLRASRLGHHR